MEEDIQDFGLNWRLIEKPYIEIANPEKFLEMLEAAGIETYEKSEIDHVEVPKNEIKEFFGKDLDNLHKK